MSIHIVQSFNAYRPAMPSTCKLKNTSAIRPLVTASSLCCLFCGVAVAHSIVLLRFVLPSSGLLVGDVNAMLLGLCFCLAPDMLALCSASSKTSDPSGDAWALSARRSVELRE